MRIAVIGAGSVGATLGRRFADLGHDVAYAGSRPASPSAAQAAAATPGATAGAPSEVVAGADVVVLAVPWSAVAEVVPALGDLGGAVLVDATNPIAPGLQLAVGVDTSGGETVAALATGARVVKAFNTVGWDVMADATFAGGRPALPVCGDDEDAVHIVSDLATALGFEALRLGGLRAARLSEPFALTWITLAGPMGHGRGLAFALLRR